MKVGIFNPYFETFGGGERYVLSVAEYFLNRGDAVDIYWREDSQKAKVKEKFAIDVAGANFLPDIFFGGKNLLSKLLVTSSYDLFFFLSDGSVPSTLARNNILHFQTPFHYHDQHSLWNRIKLSRFRDVICNSEFTKRFVDETYGVDSLVVYPPVDVAKFRAGRKEDLIVSVGHFYGAVRPKRQDLLIDAFIELFEEGLSSYRLVLLGVVHPGAEREVESWKRRARRYPIEIRPGGSFALVRDFYSRAKVYWHAAGFGVDVEKEPEKAEHFGMATVEAMASSCVPIVFPAGGQREIVVDGENGFFWRDKEELVALTKKVASDSLVRRRVGKRAVLRSRDFSKEKFFTKLERLIS